MSTNAVPRNDATSDATVARVSMKLEAVVIPVSDVDRAKEFYGRLGWRLDADFRFDNGFRVVQFTPPGSGCSVQFGANITSAVPGSAQGLYLVVSDIEAARNELAARSVNVSDVFHAGTPGAQFQPDDRAAASADPRPITHLQLLRHVQRPRRQWLAAAGGHDPASRPNRHRRDNVCVGSGPGERAQACGGRPRRSREAHRSGRPELARLVRRIHGCGAGRDGVAEVKDAKAVLSPSKESNHAF